MRLIARPCRPRYAAAVPRLSLSLLVLGFLLLTLALSAQAAEPVDVEVGRLASLGEMLGDAPVTRIQQHPEFERITVRLPSGVALPLEVTVVHPHSSPACVAHKLAVYPRLELVQGQHQAESQPATNALCARLEERGADLPIGVVRVDPTQSSTPQPPPVERAGGDDRIAVLLPGPGTRPWRPLQAVLLALGLCVLAAIPRARRMLAEAPWWDGLGIAVFGLLARLLLSPRGLQIAPDAGYERVVQAWGINGSHPLYGDGYTALHAPIQWLSGYDPAALFATHLVLSALAPPLLWALSWLCLRERMGALTAGLGLALLPIALRLAGSEVAHVPLASFELLGLLAAVAFLLRPAGLLAAVASLATGFAVHLRPEALPFCALPVGLLLAGSWRAIGQQQRRTAGLGLAAVLLVLGLVGWRLSDLALPMANGPIQARSFLTRRLWLSLVLPHWTPLEQRAGPFQTFLDLRTTPAILPLLAGLGVWLGRSRRRWPLLLALSWWALTLLPILPKAYPLMDAWRLQLPGQAPLLLLAGIGVACLPRWRVLAPIAVALSAPAHVVFIREIWAGMAAWAFLPGALARLPPSATVLFADHEVHAAKFAQVGALLDRQGGDPTPNWQPMSTFLADPGPTSDVFAWVGLTCRIATLPSRHLDNDRSINPCLQLDERCTLTPWAVTTLPELTDLDLDWLTTPVVVGLYRVDGCKLTSGAKPLR
ncbi:MAG: hypothetical protein GXP62_02420 [Oligoflexia bacterium]|nr:hypothetical protein [Oligoflexia bacterium]